MSSVFWQINKPMRYSSSMQYCIGVQCTILQRFHKICDFDIFNNIFDHSTSMKKKFKSKYSEFQICVRRLLMHVGLLNSQCNTITVCIYNFTNFSQNFGSCHFSSVIFD